jgi:hypothetical protein
MSIAQNFLQEYRKLFDTCPQRNFIQTEVENCDYTDYFSYSRDCYYCFDGSRNEGVLYADWIAYSKDSCDCSHIMNCELCYECVDCQECFNCDFLWDSSGMKDSKFCFSCKDCSDCFMCWGLRHKRFFVLNEKCGSREEYEKKVAELAGQEKLWENLLGLSLNEPRRASHLNRSENCFGDFLYQTANVYCGFDVIKEEGSTYMYDFGAFTASRDNCDCFLGGDCELCYESMYIGSSYNCNFCYKCRDSRDLEYCVQCKDCFGCSYLKHKQYFILNKSYGKKEYFEKVAELKKALKAEGLYKALWA